MEDTMINVIAIGMVLFVLIIFLVICAFSIWYSCCLYKKMGAEAWVAIIPFYNSWVWSEKVLGHGAWMFIAFIPIVGPIWQPLCCWQTCKGFGKDTLFCVLGLFFPYICLPICAFDNSTFTPQTFNI